MSEEFSDDFVVEDEEESSRPFLIAAGSLILIFIIISGVLLGFILTRQKDQSDEVSAREATNEAILASNALVQQTADAMAVEAEIAAAEATEKANATEEPEVILPSATPELVPTRDVSSGAVDPDNPAAGSGEDPGNGAGDGVGDGAGNNTGDGVGDGTGDGVSDGTGDGVGDGVGDGSGDSTTAGDALATPTLAPVVPEAGELPQTGLSVFGVAIAVLGMLGLLVVARRLRTT